MMQFFLSGYDCFTMLRWFSLCSKVNQLHVYIYPRPLRPPSHSPPSRPSQSAELNSLCCMRSTWSLVISSHSVYIYISAALSNHPAFSFPHRVPSSFLILCLFSCSANRFICTIFSRLHIHALIYDICFVFLSYFTLYDSL